jgi:rhomboid family GlyGly-CTERM serine protease
MVNSLRRIPLIAPALALTAVAIHALLGAPDYLVFERGGLAPLDLARLFTCHLTHWSWEHLLWDAAVFALVGSWCERIDRRAFAIFLATAAVAIPIIVLAAIPELDSYAGLSGIDVGAVILAVTISLFRRESPVPRSSMRGRARGQVSRKPGVTPPPRQAVALGLMGLAVVAKVVYELLAGRTVMFDADAGFVPVPLAHLVGVVVGLVVAFAKVVKQRAVRQDRTA